MFQSATPTANGSNQSESLITWAAVATPPPASPSATAASFNQPTTHVMSSPNPVSSLTSQFSLNTITDEASKTSSSAMRDPLAADDHSDFINSFLSTNQDFSSPATSLSLTKTVTEEDKLNDKTEYDSFHADFSSFLNEALTESSQQLSDPSEDDNTMKAPSHVSQEENIRSNGEHSEVVNKVDNAAPNITAVHQQSQEHAPDTFDNLDKEVSSAQDILSVCNFFYCCQLFKVLSLGFEILKLKTFNLLTICILTTVQVLVWKLYFTLILIYDTHVLNGTKVHKHIIQ